MEVTKLFKWIHLQFLLDQIDHPLTFSPHCVFLDESSNSSWTVGTALTVSLWSTMGGLWRRNSFLRWQLFRKAPSGTSSAFSGCSPRCHSSLCILCIVLPFDIIDRKPLQQGATRQDGRTFQGHSWRAPLHSTSGHFQVGRRLILGGSIQGHLCTYTVPTKENLNTGQNFPGGKLILGGSIERHMYIVHLYGIQRRT